MKLLLGLLAPEDLEDWDGSKIPSINSENILLTCKNGMQGAHLVRDPAFF